jgi:hypothetical protein
LKVLKRGWQLAAGDWLFVVLVYLEVANFECIKKRLATGGWLFVVLLNLEV